MGEWLALLKQRGGVFLDRHFVYTSGKHGSGYVNIDPILPLPEMMEVGLQLAEPFLKGEEADFDVVAAPAVGGIKLADVVQFACFSPPYTVASVFAENDGTGAYRFARQGFAELVNGARVLVVDDIVNTGGSAEKTARAVEVAGGTVIAVGCVVSRGLASAASLQVPIFYALETVQFGAYEVQECPQCRANLPIVTDIGHGAEFQEENPNYTGGFETALT